MAVSRVCCLPACRLACLQSSGCCSGGSFSTTAGAGVTSAQAAASAVTGQLNSLMGRLEGTLTREELRAASSHKSAKQVQGEGIQGKYHTSAEPACSVPAWQSLSGSHRLNLFVPAGAPSGHPPAGAPIGYAGHSHGIIMHFFVIGSVS